MQTFKGYLIKKCISPGWYLSFFAGFEIYNNRPNCVHIFSSILFIYIYIYIKRGRLFLIKFHPWAMNFNLLFEFLFFVLSVPGIHYLLVGWICITRWFSNFFCLLTYIKNLCEKWYSAGCSTLFSRLPGFYQLIFCSSFKIKSMKSWTRWCIFFFCFIIPMNKKKKHFVFDFFFFFDGLSDTQVIIFCLCV